MNGHCPYLGLLGNRDRALLAAHPRHRCYVAGHPERIGRGYQVATCLTADCEGCPRVLAHPPALRTEPPSPRPTVPMPSGRFATARYTDLLPARAWHGHSRSFELLIAGLVLSLLVAALSLGYAVYERLRAGSGQDVAAAVVDTAPAATATPTAAPPAEAPTDAATRMPSAPPVTRTLSFPTPGVLPAPVATPVPRPRATWPPTRLVIAKIGVDIPVKPVGTREVREGNTVRFVWGDVPNAGAFHNTSAYPGNGGNTVINGHRDIEGAVFAHLNQVEIGDEIVVYVGETAYPYQVTEVLIVPETFATAAQRAENTALIGAFAEERLTLVTCTPVGLATHRLVVIAHPPQAIAPDMPLAGSEP